MEREHPVVADYRLPCNQESPQGLPVWIFGNGLEHGVRRVRTAEPEQRLREVLAQMRRAIDEFKRDTFGACPQGAVNSTNPTIPGGGGAPADPRTRVVIDDCTIVRIENEMSVEEEVRYVLQNQFEPKLHGCT